MPAPDITVRQVMQPEPITVRPECPVQEVIRLMNDHRIGAVLVTEADDRLAGIFTERDLLKRVTTAVPGWREYPVSGWMTAAPHTVPADDGWEQAVALMHRVGVRHLPVIEGGRVIGIVSARGLMARRTEYLNAAVAERTRDLRRANDDLLAREEEVRRNLRAAERVHKRVLLPKAPPDDPGAEWATHYAPLDHLGGDYYDFAFPGSDHVGFLIADASGHSIPAAMVAVMTRIAFGDVAPTTARPGEVLTEMNRRLVGLADERFVTAFYGVLDRRTRVLRYASAGHPHPLRFAAGGGGVHPLSAQGFILGVIPDEVYGEREVRLEPGDRICFFTDGLVEARNEIGEMFGTDRLTGCLANHGNLTAKELLAHIIACREAFSGSEPLNDDLTVAVVAF